ncbi:MAG: DciA family protein [Pseudomonadota bacterium]
MNTRSDPVVPIGEALGRHGGLARLQQLVRESNERFEAIRPLLPAPLARHVKPGPIDEEGWSLLAPNGAVAAKLRQLQPRMEALLKHRGWQVTAIRIKVQSA